MPLISIIVPVFNTELYIERCLDSLINQSLKDIEIIVVDDMSTDNSGKIVQAYSEKYHFIKYFKMKSKGLAGGSRNLGLKNASGYYIGFVDSDDWIDTMMYEKMGITLEKSHADIAVCGVLREYESYYDTEFRYKYQFQNIIEGKAALELLCRSHNQDISISSIVCNKLYRVELLRNNDITFLSNSINEDEVFNFLCFLNAKKIAIIPDTYYHYYQRQNSITHEFSKRHIDDLLHGIRIIKLHLESTGLYELNRKNYYSFFEKSLSFVLSSLITHEQNSAIQNEYIKYLFKKSSDTIDLNEYLDYIGASRLRKFLLPFTR
ncbi:MAG: hypothetical protein POELPBGB_04189 [Bacteroidia bacterium]|nr:hypothetical protein [Bacteroidia bacterium]